jgi:hypothetical protein
LGELEFGESNFLQLVCQELKAGLHRDVVCNCQHDSRNIFDDSNLKPGGSVPIGVAGIMTEDQAFVYMPTCRLKNNDTFLENIVDVVAV